MNYFYIAILGIIVFCVLGIFFRVFFNKKNDKLIFAEFQRDRELRNQENENLKRELRDTTKSLQNQFYQVNKTVDSRLSESSKQLNERLDKSASVMGTVQRELGKMGEIGSKIENLDKILRAPKGRGSMGEENLEEILSAIFPVNLWERQYTLGKAGIVDAVVKTSNGLIPIDAKFPLPAFEKLVNADNSKERDAAKKDFEGDVKKRINEVAKYILPEKGTLDFAILFLPNENIYYEAAIRAGDLSEYARSKKVLLTGPNTMLYVLQVLFQAYQSQKFAKKAQEALSKLQGVKNQAEKLDNAISLVEKHIGNAHAKLGGVKQENTKLQNQIDSVVLMKGEISDRIIENKK